jgi:short subunit dehydrogenase-like uncharacterized protein
MSDPLLIYGATGYSGRLIARAMTELGMRPVLAARDGARLARCADGLGLEFRLAALDQPDRVDAALRDVQLVVHAAGPFSATSRPMVDACMRAGTHYVDITGEIGVIEALAQRDREARQRRIMLMPAVGFDVVAGDCLAAHVARRLPGARHLALGVSGLRYMTRGTAKSVVEAADHGVVRRDGAITRVPLGSLQHGFDFGAGLRPCLNISWGDIATAYYTTGIPNIEVYGESTPVLEGFVASSRYLGWLLGTAPVQAWLQAYVDLLPDGPTDEERAAAVAVVVAELRDGCGRRAISRLRTPEVYTFTGLTVAAIARRVLAGDVELGFQTPARVYGGDFVLSLPGVSREDLQ